MAGWHTRVRCLLVPAPRLGYMPLVGRQLRVNCAPDMGGRRGRRTGESVAEEISNVTNKTNLGEKEDYLLCILGSRIII